jgi:hypothetical protein
MPTRRSFSRRDDLLSWFYAQVELAQGRLPWPGGSDEAETQQRKEKLSVRELHSGLLRAFRAI